MLPRYPAITLHGATTLSCLLTFSLWPLHQCLLGLSLTHTSAFRHLALETFPFSTRWSTNPFLFGDIAPYILGRTCLPTGLHLVQQVSQASKKHRQNERRIEASVSRTNRKQHTVWWEEAHQAHLIDHDISINLMCSGALIAFVPWVFPQLYSNMLKVIISIISHDCTHPAGDSNCVHDSYFRSSNPLCHFTLLKSISTCSVIFIGSNS